MMCGRRREREQRLVIRWSLVGGSEGWTDGESLRSMFSRLSAFSFTGDSLSDSSAEEACLRRHVVDTQSDFL